MGALAVKVGKEPTMARSELGSIPEGDEDEQAEEGSGEVDDAAEKVRSALKGGSGEALRLALENLLACGGGDEEPEEKLRNSASRGSRCHLRFCDQTS